MVAVFMLNPKKFFMADRKDERPLAYPLPTETDRQLQNQPEYVDQQPNDFSDKSVSDMPAEAPYQKQTNEPETNEGRSGEEV
jgi:hypothetical protein